MKATPGPLLRRPSFWLGLFVACFLAWAWWISSRTCLVADVGAVGGRLGLMRIDGRTVFLWAPEIPFKQDWFSIEPRATFPALDYQLSLAEAVGYRWFSVPDSAVFFSFVGLWGGWLALSDWRRKTRADSSSSFPEI